MPLEQAIDILLTANTRTLFVVYVLFVEDAAYFDSVDGRTPPRWSSTSLVSFPDCSGSFRRICIINTNCFDGFQQARC